MLAPLQLTWARQSNLNTARRDGDVPMEPFAPEQRTKPAIAASVQYVALRRPGGESPFRGQVRAIHMNRRKSGCTYGGFCHLTSDARPGDHEELQACYPGRGGCEGIVNFNVDVEAIRNLRVGLFKNAMPRDAESDVVPWRS